MKWGSKYFAVAVMAGLAAILGLYYFLGHQADTTYSFRTKGNPQASMKIMEFSDFQCPSCAKGASLVDEYLKKYPDGLFLEFKHYPLMSIHRYAFSIAVASECAGKQGKFWPFHDLAFNRQSVLLNTLYIDMKLMNMADEIGLEGEAFKTCLQNEEIKSSVLKDVERGKSLRINSTPTFIVNEKMVVGQDALKKVLEDYFKEI